MISRGVYKGLTYKKAMELVKLQSRMGPSSSRKPTSAVLASEDVHKVCTGKRSTVSKVVKPCYRCGDGSHVPSKCPLLKATCLGCGKVGHIKRACFKTTKSKKKSKGSQHTVRSSQETLLTIHCLWYALDLKYPP